MITKIEYAITPIFNNEYRGTNLYTCLFFNYLVDLYFDDQTILKDFPIADVININDIFCIDWKKIREKYPSLSNDQCNDIWEFFWDNKNKIRIQLYNEIVKIDFKKLEYKPE